MVKSKGQHNAKSPAAAALNKIKLINNKVSPAPPDAPGPRGAAATNRTQPRTKSPITAKANSGTGRAGQILLGKNAPAPPKTPPIRNAGRGRGIGGGKPGAVVINMGRSRGKYQSIGGLSQAQVSEYSLLPPPGAGSKGKRPSLAQTAAATINSLNASKRKKRGKKLEEEKIKKQNKCCAWLKTIKLDGAENYLFAFGSWEIMEKNSGPLSRLLDFLVYRFLELCATVGYIILSIVQNRLYLSHASFWNQVVHIIYSATFVYHVATEDQFRHKVAAARNHDEYFTSLNMNQHLSLIGSHGIGSEFKETKHPLFRMNKIIWFFGNIYYGGSLLGAMLDIQLAILLKTKGTIDLYYHMYALLFVFMDLTLTAYPIWFLHVFYTWVYVLSYGIYTLLAQMYYGKPLFEFIDWLHKPVAAIRLLSTALIGLIFIQLFLVLLAKLRGLSMVWCGIIPDSVRDEDETTDHLEEEEDSSESSNEGSGATAAAGSGDKAGHEAPQLLGKKLVTVTDNEEPKALRDLSREELYAYLDKHPSENRIEVLGEYEAAQMQKEILKKKEFLEDLFQQADLISLGEDEQLHIDVVRLRYQQSAREWVRLLKQIRENNQAQEQKLKQKKIEFLEHLKIEPPMPEHPEQELGPLKNEVLKADMPRRNTRKRKKNPTTPEEAESPLRPSSYPKPLTESPPLPVPGHETPRHRTRHPVPPILPQATATRKKNTTAPEKSSQGHTSFASAVRPAGFSRPTVPELLMNGLHQQDETPSSEEPRISEHRNMAEPSPPLRPSSYPPQPMTETKRHHTRHPVPPFPPQEMITESEPNLISLGRRKREVDLRFQGIQLSVAHVNLHKTNAQLQLPSKGPLPPFLTGLPHSEHFRPQVRESVRLRLQGYGRPPPSSLKGIINSKTLKRLVMKPKPWYG